MKSAHSKRAYILDGLWDILVINKTKYKCIYLYNKKSWEEKVMMRVGGIGEGRAEMVTVLAREARGDNF